MPIYEYHCNKCNKNFEFLVFGDDEIFCPSCNSKDVNRMLSTCGFVSKGSSGKTVSSSASASSCTGCTSTNCSSCGI
ncbi:Zinc ribbon domain-containing protein [Candidatus Magnetomoraceae bacterium gMMP-15]